MRVGVFARLGLPVEPMGVTGLLCWGQCSCSNLKLLASEHLGEAPRTPQLPVLCASLSLYWSVRCLRGVFSYALRRVFRWNFMNFYGPFAVEKEG